MDVQDLLFSMFLRNHRFTEHSDELRARSAWTTTAKANFKHLMYNVRKNAERACASTDKNQWKEHGPVWMRKEYWTELCDIWGAGKWNANSSKAKQNRAAHPEANESYCRGMDERYGDDSQHPELDPDIWVAASGAPKKGHVYGFGHSLGTTRVISSCSSSISHATSPFTTPAAPGGSSSAAPTMTPDMFRTIVNETVSQNISTIISHTVSQMLAELGIPGNRAPPAQQPPPLEDTTVTGVRPKDRPQLFSSDRVGTSTAATVSVFTQPTPTAQSESISRSEMEGLIRKLLAESLSLFKPHSLQNYCKLPNAYFPLGFKALKYRKYNGTSC
ncbi:hypothetical protein Taro_023738 [Colocasia esculenta]|uniref:Uncharacterized protein n=1 Tax=Colocasia esculenta TaxID=4460 RepID=A0A843VFD9_COLES|nr:hypothetical protein [Colocasia esculenta]